MIHSSKDKALLTTRTGLLAFLLRLCGLIDCLALIVALMPLPWIATLHSHLGIGPFPSDAITHYLARSSSLMYAVHGLLLLYCSFQINRYLPLIKLLAFIAIVHGLCLIGIDYYTAMPWWWTCLEGPLLIMWGMLILLLITSKSSFRQ